MFPNRRYIPPSYPQRRPQGSPQQTGRNRDVFSYFRTPDGTIDFNKINGTAKQMKQLVDQVSPWVSKFFQR
ncbi:YppG family protein [Bacillus sp. AK128]